MMSVVGRGNEARGPVYSSSMAHSNVDVSPVVFREHLTECCIVGEVNSRLIELVIALLIIVGTPLSCVKKAHGQGLNI